MVRVSDYNRGSGFESHIYVYVILMHVYMYMCMLTLCTCKIVYGIFVLGEEVPLADYELPLSQAEILQSGMFQASISHVLIALV